MGHAVSLCALFRPAGPPRLTGGLRVPTSVLLAVLAAAGLLALAPALVRRYDATERLVAERGLPTARGIARPRPPAPAPGLLALAPALVRRYDATERLVAERALSTARVIERRRRQRTVPGRFPV